ncbi:MAG: transcription antitermination factor NusB [Ignavibacteria bacterium]|nr:transcription antitermination factor NusB [Ignavibacteria bacterium]
MGNRRTSRKKDDTKKEIVEAFYLSKTKKINGTRSMVRGKVLEVLFAYEISGEPLDNLFEHIFFREFKFDPEEPETKRLLTKEEILELEADVPIQWEEDDIRFAKELIEKTQQTRPFAIEEIKKSIANWEFERLTVVDRLILEIAIAELLHFANIDPEVTINEAIEVAKQYSTEKSGIFVNGVLDSLYKKFSEQGLIHKIKEKQ